MATSLLIRNQSFLSVFFALLFATTVPLSLHQSFTPKSYEGAEDFDWFQCSFTQPALICNFHTKTEEWVSSSSTPRKFQQELAALRVQINLNNKQTLFLFVYQYSFLSLPICQNLCWNNMSFRASKEASSCSWKSSFLKLLLQYNYTWLNFD